MEEGEEKKNVKSLSTLVGNGLLYEDSPQWQINLTELRVGLFAVITAISHTRISKFVPQGQVGGGGSGHPGIWRVSLKP